MKKTMSTWKKIKRFLFGPKTELEFVEAALQRYKDQLYNMDIGFNYKDHCCPDCFYGSKYGNLIDKIERVEIQRDRLRKRKLK